MFFFLALSFLVHQRIVVDIGVPVQRSVACFVACLLCVFIDFPRLAYSMLAGGLAEG